MLSLPAVLIHARAGAFAMGLRESVAAEPSIMVLEAGTLKEFDSSALAVILACRREALLAGKAFSVRNLPTRLRQLADLYGVAKLIPAAT